MERSFRGGPPRSDTAAKAGRSRSPAPLHRRPAVRQYWRRSGAGLFRRRRDRQSDHRPVADFWHVRDLLQHGPHVQRSANRRDEIGRELNVRYVLEGSVQRAGNRMRVNAQLIEAETGGHLWAERFDKPVADLFDMQDEIVSRLANRLGAGTRLRRGEERRAFTTSRTRWISTFLGLPPSIVARQRLNLNTARAYFDRALEIDPANVDALIYPRVCRSCPRE